MQPCYDVAATTIINAHYRSPPQISWPPPLIPTTKTIIVHVKLNLQFNKFLTQHPNLRPPIITIMWQHFLFHLVSFSLSPPYHSFLNLKLQLKIEKSNKSNRKIRDKEWHRWGGTNMKNLDLLDKWSDDDQILFMSSELDGVVEIESHDNVREKNKR